MRGGGRARERERERGRERESRRTDDRVRKNERNTRRFTAREVLSKTFDQTDRDFQGCTLFVDNITTHMTRDWMEDIVRYECGRGLIGVYVSFKRRKSTSKLFGFIRFEGTSVAQKAINKMDGLMVGGSRLRVTFAKFGRTLIGEKKHGTDHLRSKLMQEDKPSKKNFIPPNRKGLMDGRKFVEVVNQVDYSKREERAKTKNREENRNITTTQEKEGEVRPNITVSPEGDKLEWLRRSMIAFTKHRMDAKQLRMELQRNNILYESLIPWGEFKFIVVIRSSEDRNEAITKTRASGIEGITGVRPWKEDDTIFTNEGMWFTCVGVPIQCWTEPMFHKIGSFWGKVLAIHAGNTF